MAISVGDFHGNYNEALERHADVLGRSEERRRLFAAIYAGKKSVKTVSELAATTGLTRKRILTLGHELARHDVVSQTPRATADGKSETAYAKTKFAKSNRDKIITLSSQPKSKRKLETKRQTVVIERPARTPDRSAPRSRRTGGRKLKVLFALAAPDDQGKIRPDHELRDIKEQIQKSSLRDKISLEICPAIDAAAFTDELNRYRPDVIHFSGHGGAGAIAMESLHEAGSSSSHLSLQVLGRLLKATDSPPKIVILNACDTAEDASHVLEGADVVIAMSTSISDFAARVFGQRLWGALASGQPVGKAFDQAVIGLEYADLLEESTTPVILHQKDVDITRYRVVG